MDTNVEINVEGNKSVTNNVFIACLIVGKNCEFINCEFENGCLFKENYKFTKCKFDANCKFIKSCKFIECEFKDKYMFKDFKTDKIRSVPFNKVMDVFISSFNYLIVCNYRS